MLNKVWPRILSAFRAERGLTQEQAAEALSTSAQSLSRWQSGKAAPNPGQWDDIAEGMGLSPIGLGRLFADTLREVCALEEAAAAGSEGKGSGTAEATVLTTATAAKGGACAAIRPAEYNAMTGKLAAVVMEIGTMGMRVLDGEREIGVLREVTDHLMDAQTSAVSAHVALGKLQELDDEPDDED